MPRKAKVILGPSALSKIMENLTKAPRPTMNTVKALKLTYAFRNDHFGARHFVKEDLPRIRYANPKVEIEINKVPKLPQDTWKPEMVVTLNDGTTKTLDMSQKLSSSIFQELMDLAGGHSWERWKRERTAAGLPIVDILKPKGKTLSKKKSTANYEDLFAKPDMTKTGAAAVLP